MMTTSHVSLLPASKLHTFSLSLLFLGLVDYHGICNLSLICELGGTKQSSCTQDSTLSSGEIQVTSMYHFVSFPLSSFLYFYF